VLDLTLSNPTRAGLRYDEARILQSLASPQAMDYDPQPLGLPGGAGGSCGLLRESARGSALRSRAADSYHQPPVKPIPSCSRLLCNPGDELLVPKPSYPLFEFLADLQDVRLAPYPLIYDHGWQMDFPSLEKL